MKTITLSALLLVITISLSSFVISHQSATTTVTNAKGPGILRVHRQGRAVSLTWTNSANAAHYSVQRSDDFGESFNEIADIPNGGGHSSSYKDESFFPGTLYYRVVTIDNSNNESCSNVEVIKITQR